MGLIDNREVNIVSGNGLVPSGNKPIPEPMLTQFYVDTKPIPELVLARFMSPYASLGHNELKKKKKKKKFWLSFLE